MRAEPDVPDDSLFAPSIEGADELIAAALASVEQHLSAAKPQPAPTPPPPPVELDIDLRAFNDTIPPDDGDADQAVSAPDPEWVVGDDRAPSDGQHAALAEAKARIAELEEELTHTRAKLKDVRERGNKLHIRHERLKELYERLRQEHDALNLGAVNQARVLAELRTLAQRLEEDRERAKGRHGRELTDMKRFGNEALIRELLPVLDHLELAYSHREREPQQLAEGVRIIVSQLQHVLERIGLSRVIGERGDRFDPSFHEAISYIQSEGLESGQICETHQVGYTLNGRLMRAARVTVARSAPVGSSPAQNPSPSGE
ncbi:nucleotide exchange factor GrpE [Myxococcota bacterium]|nr:nucleotide exchange factor GrpE [Myxococcota bacterium]